MRLARALTLRILFGVLSLLFISFVTFVADEVSPGDAVDILAGEKSTPEQKARMREEMGLNRPMLVRYAEYVGKAATGDFGQSYTGTKQPVAEILAQNLPMTTRLAGLAITFAAALGIALGTLAAIHENRMADRAVLTLSTFGVTVPNFVLAPLLVYVFCLQLDLLPQTWSPNRVASDVYYLILPVVILAARPTAMLTRLTRASMLETMRQEFIKMAVAKGVPPGRLILRHALRNAILPVVTAIGTSFGYLLTGSFVVETAFLLPGIGRETIQAIQERNTPVVQACILATGAMFIFINTVVDLTLPLLDPRIRESQV